MKDGLVGRGNHSNNNNSNNTTGIADDCNCTTSIQPMEGRLLSRVFLGGWLWFMILIVPEVLLAVV